jgi:hypothetical protein
MHTLPIGTRCRLQNCTHKENNGRMATIVKLPDFTGWYTVVIDGEGPRKRLSHPSMLVPVAVKTVRGSATEAP